MADEDSKNGLEEAGRRLLEHLSKRAAISPKEQRLIDALSDPPPKRAAGASNVTEFTKKSRDA